MRAQYARRRAAVLFTSLGLLWSSHPSAYAESATPLAVYGRLPTLEEVALSPDGTRIAFVRTAENRRVVAIISLVDHTPIGVLDAGSVKLRSLQWADNNHLIVGTSETSLPWGFERSQDIEWGHLQIYDVAKRESIQFPDELRLRASKIMNVVTGNTMLRQVDGKTFIFVQGVQIDRVTIPALIRLDVATGEQTVQRVGSLATQGWLVDGKGAVVAQQDYSEASRQWTLYTAVDGQLLSAVSGKAEIESPQLLGFGPTGEMLLMQIPLKKAGAWALFSLKTRKFDATQSVALTVSSKPGLQTPLLDPASSTLIGMKVVADETTYLFSDDKREAQWKSIAEAFKGDRVSFVSASDDFQKIVVRVDGPHTGLIYELVDLRSHKAEKLGNIYDGLGKTMEVQDFDYDAADGLNISGYLTLPANRAAANLPLVVLPHGGPGARDTADFDWWSQAIADQGYAVLRPNFRGSTVDGELHASGYGEWGKKMQTDLSDGVRELVKKGVVDPARVCIVGASYGGYAALAGVALDPGIYRCAVSVAGISDPQQFLRRVDENTRLGSKQSVRFWDRFMGVTGSDDPALDAISPVKHIAAITVPVLLIHGKDDTVVPFEQSQIIFDALRRAGKPVELVQLKDEDHWLSRSATRQQMLEATVAFLKLHNPPDN